jgi:hypothetical protein
MVWSVEYASVLLNRFEVGRDGKTAYERNKGKKSRMLGLEFGESILWRRKPVGNNLAKLAVMWDTGIYLGIKGSTGEIIVGNGDGISRTRTVRRRPVEERWSAAEIEQIKGVPWERRGLPAEGDVLDPRGGIERLPEVLPETEKEEIKNELVMPRSFYTKRDDYEKHGYTRGCPGCRALLTGKSTQKHSVQCRERMAKEMHDDERVKTAKRKRDEFLEKISVPGERQDKGQLHTKDKIVESEETKTVDESDHRAVA